MDPEYFLWTKDNFQFVCLPVCYLNAKIQMVHSTVKCYQDIYEGDEILIVFV